MDWEVKPVVNVLAVIVAGVVGTAAMIVTILLLPTVSHMPRLDVTLFVGTAFTPEENRARAYGWLILCFNGSVLAMVSALMWKSGIGNATWFWGLVYGAFLGILTIIVLPLMIRFHPHPQDAQEWPPWMLALAIWVGHLAYGLVMALVYNLLA